MARIFFITFLATFFFSCNPVVNDQEVHHEKLDKFLDSLNHIKSFEEGEKLLDKTTNLIQILPNDSIRARYQRRVACEYYNIGDLEKYRQKTLDNLEFTLEIKDTLNMGKSFYDLGDYYYDISINDSAFYYYNQAIKTIPITNTEKARCQLKIAKLYKNENQLIESEVHVMKTIQYANELNDNRLIYECYNLLGIIQHELSYFDEAIVNFDLAKSYINKLSSDPQFHILIAENYNNKGIVYLKTLDLKNAFENFETALKIDRIKIEHQLLYAILSDNLAYTKLLKGSLNSPSVFLENLSIREKLNNKLGIIISQKRLGEFYLSKKDSSLALGYFDKAYSLAEATNSSREQLELLKLKQKANPGKTHHYQNSYMSISDSIMFDERRTRNKFAKIEYETEQVINEKKILSRRMDMLLLSSIFLLMVFTTVYLIYRHKVQNKLMILQAEQQKNNEETYNLILNQNEKIEQIRNFEKNRIATELHDGVLSKMFGIRIHLERLLLTNCNQSKEEATIYINKLKALQSEIRQLSHDLVDDVSLHKQSFVQLLEEYLEEFENDFNIQTLLKVDDAINWDLCTSEQKFHIFRIIQESLTNVRKYAKATHVVVKFILQNNQLIFQIIDDGQGYNTKKMHQGIGLKNMQFRMDNLGGKLEIISSSKGTIIEGYVRLEG